VPPESTSGGGPRIAGRRQLIVLCSAIFGLAVIFLLLFNRHGHYKTYQLGQERTRLDWENARLAEENTRLGRTIDRLHHDPEMIQDLIRQELNFVQKNEIIIQLPEPGGPKPQAGVMPQPRPAPPQQDKAGAVGSRQAARKAPGAPRPAP
jgi:cell division protein FtsB